MTRPLTVSVVIPCHNYGRFLPQTLACVFEQTYAAEQIIVVDDGSSDDSSLVAASFPGVTVIRQARQGIAGARNAGAAVATGDLIAFLDADDLWPADSLDVRVLPLAGNEALAATYGLVEQFISPEVDAVARARLVCRPGQTAARLAGSLLVRRSIFEAVGPFDTAHAMGETMDWIARFDDAGAQAEIVQRLVLRRRIHGANTVQSKSTNAEYFNVLRGALHRRRPNSPEPV